MKLHDKILLLGAIWAITLPLGWVLYPYYWKWDIALIMGYPVWWAYSELSRHILGYSILGYIFGWIAMPLAFVDEILQHFIRGKQFNMIQMVCNIASTLLGIWLSKRYKIVRSK